MHPAVCGTITEVQREVLFFFFPEHLERSTWQLSLLSMLYGGKEMVEEGLTRSAV